ncbi:uncharacterized protein LOC134189471 [Corticium candelabrum]|uniref:uncharacterized protein LOC134189471 n=1 Tax=Corticium candelabrum TaxID=121492 RepID=UPI002E264A29|nr:uncharacterized protein LOC134189471 [Corticium candelabrum]
MSWRSALSKNLRELRIHLCQTSVSSQGTREFIEAHYVDIKRLNPTFPILIRECSGIQPRMYARYDFGKERKVELTDMSKEQVFTALESLVTSETTT